MTFVDLTHLESRGRSIVFGCAVGLAFVIGVGIAKTQSRWAVVVATPIWAIGVYYAYTCIFQEANKSSLFASMVGTSFIWGDLESFAIAVLVAIAVSGWIIGLLYRLNCETAGKILALCRVGIAMLAVVIIALCIATIDIGLRLAFRYPTTVVQTVEMTQFDKLIRIADRFKSSQVFDRYPIANDSSKRKEIQEYHRDFIELKNLLESDLVCGMPCTNDLFESLSEIHVVRTIAKALSEKARIEFADGMADKSLADSITIVRLREPLSANMLIVSELFSISIEGMGLFSAAESIPAASREALSEALQIMLEIDAKPYDPKAIYLNDQAALWRWSSWWGRLWVLCDAAETRDIFDEHVMEAIRRSNATRQQCIAMLALELYRQENGGYPENLQHLVPEYLPAVPHDPFGDETANDSLKYRPIDDSKDYLLYSVWLNRIDDQGQLSVLGYGGHSSSDLNFKEAAKLSLVQRDTDLEEAELETVE